MRVGLCSLGCKVNIYEAEYVISLLKNHGYDIVDFSDFADIYIINTCSVTNEADRKSRKFINQAKKNNKDAIIVVMGCYSQVKANEINADIVLGNKDKSRIIDIIDEYIINKKKIKNIYDLTNVCFEDMEIANFESHTRAFVKIQDGCNAFCSYCIIPYTRGRIRSKKFNDVVNEVNNLVKNGYKEIILTGIHTGRYGIDINSSLEELLNELVKIEGLYRLRLSSIEINEITDNIIDLIKNNKVMARHLHIPLQSGSDKILKLMNRRYDVSYFLNRINYIRNEIKDISITTDLIVGFPNESDSDFKDTLDVLDKIKFMHIHTFPYSKRDGTKASMMSNQVDGNVKKKRVREVINLSNKYENLFYKKYIGNILDGVVEVQESRSVVHTSNFIPVIVEDNVNNNEVVKIKITSVNELEVKGVIVNNEDI